MRDGRIERIARAYCRNLGLDPDEVVSHGAKSDANGFAFAICLCSPRWELVVDEVIQWEAMRDAISTGGDDGE